MIRLSVLATRRLVLLASLLLLVAGPLAAGAPGERSSLEPFLLGGIQTHELDHQRWVAALHKAGMNAVQVTVYAHQGPWNTAKLWYAEQEPSVLAEIRAARRAGLQVVLVLRVALEHGDPENRHLWHGLTYPETEAATEGWFRTYSDFAVKWARIAEREGVEVLGVASEMNSLAATLPVEELPGLPSYYLDDASQERLRTLVGRSEHLFSEDVRVSMGAGDFVSLDDFLIQRNAAERVWARAYTFDGHEEPIAAINARRRLLDRKWRQLIDRVRAVYSGRLTLAANFDNYHEVSFWDALDFIGINAYFKLRQSLETPVTEEGLAAGWRGIFRDIDAFRDRHGLEQRVIFTELGYTRWRGVTVAPWSSKGFIPMWDPSGETAKDRAFFWEAQPYDDEERALALRALHRVYAEGATPLSGVLYWKLSSVLDLQRFEPFMLYLGEDGGDPMLEALQRFSAGSEGGAGGIRPFTPRGEPANAAERLESALVRGDAPAVRSALAAAGGGELSRPGLLHRAVRLGRAESARALVESGGVSVSARDSTGALPLHWTCYQPQADLVDLLVPAGDDAPLDERGETPLMKCARLDNVAVARVLLKRGVGGVHARNERGRSALHLAADQASLELVELLVAAGADPDLRDGDGRTARHTAAKRGDLGIVRALSPDREKGAANGEGNYPAAEAAIHGRSGAFEWLFEPERVRERNVYGQSLLHLAAHGGSEEILGSLLEHFENVDPVDDDGWTPLVFATRNGQVEMARRLVEAGADIAKANLEGTSALHLAAGSYEPRLIQLFLQRDPDLRLADGEGNTALHHAAGWGRLENLRLLLEAGADPKLLNKKGQTPYEVAEDAGRRRAALALRPDRAPSGGAR
ncbi:MAG: ankyrin repeat domain-containing protein [Acidobacteriota bacterium]